MTTNRFTYVCIVITGNKMNNEYRTLTKALEVVGFGNATVRRNVATYSFNSKLSSFNRLDVTALDNLCKDLKKQSEEDDSDLEFGLQQEVLLKGLMHFVQDLTRVGRSIEDLDLDEINLEAIDNAIERAKNREAFIKQSKSVSAAGDPGKFDKSKQWFTWRDSFINYLSLKPGSTGIPLSYVIREHQEPLEDAIYEDFTDEMVACAPLNGQTYESDRRLVHQYLMGFITGTSSEDYVKKTYVRGRCHNNGRMSFQALRLQYEGRGEMNRRLSEAAMIEKTLFYKSEKALSFTIFSARMERMFNIYKEENRPKSEDEKLEILFRKIQCSQLATNVASLQAQYDINENGITYDRAMNHLASIITNNNMSNRFVNQVQTNHSTRHGNSNQGTRGRATNWSSSGRSYYNKRNNTQGGRGGRGRKRQGSNTWIPSDKWNKMSAKERWEAKNNKNKKASIQSKIQQVSYNKEFFDDLKSSIISAVTQSTEDQATDNSNAGNAFGGRNEAKRRKTGPNRD